MNHLNMGIQAGDAFILLYADEDFDQCDNMTHGAIRYYLGGHQKAPLLAVCGDMGWSSVQVRRHINMIGFWNRFLSIDGDRLTEKVFNWDHSLCAQNWSEDILQL